MKAKLIKIGNSKGIRIPKALLNEVDVGEEVILEASKGTIVIRPASAPRQGWEQAFKEMAKNRDDQLLDKEPITSTWDKEEWEWK